MKISSADKLWGREGTNRRCDCDSYRPDTHSQRSLMTAVPAIFVFGPGRAYNKATTCNVLARFLTFLPASYPTSVGLVPFPQPEGSSYQQHTKSKEKYFFRHGKLTPKNGFVVTRLEMKRCVAVMKLITRNNNHRSGHLIETRGGLMPPLGASGARSQMPYFVFPRKAKYRPPT